MQAWGAADMGFVGPCSHLPFLPWLPAGNQVHRKIQTSGCLCQRMHRYLELPCFVSTRTVTRVRNCSALCPADAKSLLKEAGSLSTLWLRPQLLPLLTLKLFAGDRSQQGSPHPSCVVAQILHKLHDSVRPDDSYDFANAGS